MASRAWTAPRRAAQHQDDFAGMPSATDRRDVIALLKVQTSIACGFAGNRRSIDRVTSRKEAREPSGQRNRQSSRVLQGASRRTH
jgi:hypothetical protein